MYSRVRPAFLFLSAIAVVYCRGETFSFRPYLEGQSSRISASVQSINLGTGAVTLNGGASGLAFQPQWDFGDGTTAGSWFPASHTYAATNTNYIVRVTGLFTDGATNWTEVLVRFVKPSFVHTSLSDAVAVAIPGTNVTLASRMPGYGFSGALTFFPDSTFTGSVSRVDAEYILTVAASIQGDMVRSNVFLPAGGFRQYVLRDPAAGGMYSLWYATPVAFGAGDGAFGLAPQYSSFFHEMGHNVTLNFPANYYYGGKIDGCANTMYSEAMAQIMQHATAYEIINRAQAFNLPYDLVFEIKQSAISAIGIMRAAYVSYQANGSKFCSWNGPGAGDETFDTFMTLAFKFCEQAEVRGQGYTRPARRMADLLGVFNSDLKARYDQNNDTPSAATFRSTLMVTAMSYAFAEDMRPVFRQLNFPVDSATYDSLICMVAPPTLTTQSIIRTAVEVSWTAETGRSYRVECTTNLTSGTWTNMTGILFGTNSAMSVLDSTADVPVRFYRVQTSE